MIRHYLLLEKVEFAWNLLRDRWRKCSASASNGEACHENSGIDVSLDLRILHRCPELISAQQRQITAATT